MTTKIQDWRIVINSSLQNTCSSHPEVCAVKHQTSGSSEWVSLTYHQLMEQVKVAGRALLSLGLSKHHSVAILGLSSSYPALVCHLASVFAG